MRPKSDSQNSQRPPTKNPEQQSLYGAWLAEDHEDGRGMRWSLAFAAVLHGLLLAATIPTITQAEIAEPEKPKIYHVRQTPRFKQPPPPTETLPPKREKKLIIPADDPGPDIYVSDEELAAMEVEFEVAEVPDWIPEAPPAPKIEGPLQVGGKVLAPTRLSGPQPQYTEIARRARIQGIVILRTVVLRDGTVSEIEILKELPMGLTEEAVKAVREWRFEPGTLQGKPVDVVYVLTVNFRLQ